VLESAHELEDGLVRDRRTMILEPDRMLLAQIGKESAVVARQRLAQITLLGRQMSAASDELQRERERGEDRVRARDEWSETLENRIQELRAQTSDLRERVASRDAQLRSAEARVAELKSQIDRERAELSARLEQMGGQIAEERTEHRRSLEEERSKREQHLRDIESRSEELARFKKEIEREREVLEHRCGQFEKRVRSLESDRESLARLCDQQEHENGVLRNHLDDLLASRWRKLGQRIGVAMVLPWERDEQEVAHHNVGGNGKA